MGSRKSKIEISPFTSLPRPSWAMQPITESMFLLTNKTSAIYTKFALNRIWINQRHFRTESFHTKNEKLKRMLPKEPTSSYKVPVVNLSNTILKNRELQQLQYGLDHCFVDKNKNTKRNLVTSLETVAERVTPIVEDSEKEDFHQFIRIYTDIFWNNIYRAHDYTYYNLKRLLKDPETVISAHYWILCFYSINIFCNNCVAHDIFNFLETSSTPMLSKYVTFQPFKYKAIQWFPIDEIYFQYICIYICMYI